VFPEPGWATLQTEECQTQKAEEHPLHNQEELIPDEISHLERTTSSD